MIEQLQLIETALEGEGEIKPSPFKIYRSQIKAESRLATFAREGTSEPLNKQVFCSTVSHYANSLMQIKK